MSKRPRLDPRSLFQGWGTIGLLPLILLASLAALISWGWQQYRGDDRHPISPPSRMGAPLAPAFNPPEQRSRGNLAAYFTSEDYPADALRDGAQGTVAFLLSISPEGRVTGCQIAGSSGSPSLDSTTCRLLRARARLQPALDAGGQEVPDQMSGRIRWVLPAG